MEMGQPGRRGHVLPADRAEIAASVGHGRQRSSPPPCAGRAPPELPELSEPEVQRHYLRLAQETLGMMGISLFGTCTMKYHPPVAEHAGAALARRAASAPARGHAAGRARDRPRLRPDPARAVRHGPVRVPGRRRGRRGLYPRLRHPRLPPGARRARAAQRDRHLDPGPPLQRRHRRRRRVQGDYPDARGGRLPLPRRAEGRRLQSHRGADDQQPRRHGHLQPAHQGVGADRPRGGRPLPSTTTPTSTA